MTKAQIDTVLEGVRHWPPEDQAELAELAREIEARRSGIYVLSEDEREAITEARNSELVPDEQAAAFWKRHNIG